LQFCVTTDVYFVQYLGCQIFAGRRLYTAWVEFPCPNKVDHYIHNYGDRKSEWLSLSLLYNFLFPNTRRGSLEKENLELEAVSKFGFLRYSRITILTRRNIVMNFLHSTKNTVFTRYLRWLGSWKIQRGNSQNFLGKFVRFYVTLGLNIFSLLRLKVVFKADIIKRRC